MRNLVTGMLLLGCGAALIGCGRQGGGKLNPPLVLSSALASGTGLNAGGEAPLWALQIRRKDLTFSSQKIASITLANTGPKSFPRGAVWTGDAGGRPFKAAVTATACKDSATGLSYPLTAEVLAVGFTYHGCAAKVGQGLGPRA